MALEIGLSYTSKLTVQEQHLATAELVKIEGRKLWFHISASDDEGIIGEGDH